MDSMSYRNNRPAQRPSEAEAEVPARPAPVAAPVTPRAKHASKSSTPNRKLIVFIVLIIALLLGVAAWFYQSKNGSAGVIDSSKYQAVFFTNGQVYFGKLSNVNGDYMRLKNVYYLQNKEQTADDASPQSASKQDATDVELIKLGNEIHGPEDEMLISKDQILFLENLKPAGTVSQTITNFQKTKQ
jgi:hypothetical protein